MEETKTERIKALLLAVPSDHFEKLEKVLKQLGIKSSRASGVAEANQVLSRTDVPWLVFTDTELPDGNWETVLKLAAKTAAPPRVIVVSRVVDLKLYIETLTQGADDFIVPPFLLDDVAWVVQGAILHASAPVYHAKHAAVA
ncbi:MAG TPA: response regulator [Terriglobia bacterium]|nr:response regulator [Terriglobia bacterium]